MFFAFRQHTDVCAAVLSPPQTAIPLAYSCIPCSILRIPHQRPRNHHIHPLNLRRAVPFLLPSSHVSRNSSTQIPRVA